MVLALTDFSFGPCGWESGDETQLAYLIGKVKKAVDIDNKTHRDCILSVKPPEWCSIMMLFA